VIADQLSWYLGGPALGLCVVVIRVLMNRRLGVTGGIEEVVDRVGRRSLAFDWRAWFAIGVLLGGTAFVLLSGHQAFSGYGWLTDTFRGGDAVLIAPILVVAGLLIGYGTRAAGGCTSGNGLSGTSILSPAAFAATATFFGTAIVVSFVIEALI
jgi:uncharacterized membrane protein YedE/YeeE